MQNLDAIKSTRKTGSEPFRANGKSLPNTLLSFWQWSSSELVGNALRGMLAEYIVASDLGCADGVRQEWDNYDIETQDGIKVEVKSGAYLQSWSQQKLSTIQFGIQPTYGWDSKSNTRSTSKIRQTDVYVFCLLKHEEKATVDPLIMDQWGFYVLSTKTLNQKLGEQKSVSLSVLKQLNPLRVRYGSINKAIKQQLAI